MKKLIVVFIMIFVLQGCGLFRRGETLDAPSNIRKVDEVIRWDAVEGARAYRILRDGQTVQVPTNQISIFDLPNGDYTIEIRAIKGDLRSDWTEFSFSINRTLDHPSNVRIEDGVLKWDAPSTYSSFNVLVNDATHSITDLTFDLSGLDSEQLYRLKVQTSHAGSVSAYSSERLYHTFTEVVETKEATFNQAVLRHFGINLTGVTEVDAVILNHRALDFTLGNESIALDYSELINLDLDKVYTIEIITNLGLIEIELSLEYEEKPFLVSSRTMVYVPNEDLVFEFELYGGSFSNLSGQSISSTDYTFEDGILTINAAFIEGILTNDPDRSRVIFSYLLTSEGNDTFIGYLFIEIE